VSHDNIILTCPGIKNMIKTNILRNIMFVLLIGVLMYLWLKRTPRGELPAFIKQGVEWF